MMMVPVLVVMGGTFAFSAWSGSGNAFFGQTAATVSYSETMYFNGTNAVHNPLTVSNGQSSQSVTQATAEYMVSSASGHASSVLNVYANVSYLVPGQYVNFTVVIHNNGNTVLNTSTVSVAGGHLFNGLGQQLSSPQGIVSFFNPPITNSYIQNVATNGIPNIANGNGPLYLMNATSSGSTTALLAPGASITYDVVAVLPSIAPTSWQGYTFDMEISIPISTIA